jgi:hypothetical protein
MDCAGQVLDRKWSTDVELLQIVLLDVLEDLRPEILTFSDGNRIGMPLGLFGKGEDVRPSQDDLLATLEKIVGDFVGGDWLGSGLCSSHFSDRTARVLQI